MVCNSRTVLAAVLFKCALTKIIRFGVGVTALAALTIALAAFAPTGGHPSREFLAQPTITL